MRKLLIVVTIASVCAVSRLEAAQQPAPAPARPAAPAPAPRAAAPAPPAPRAAAPAQPAPNATAAQYRALSADPVNVRYEIRIVEEGGPQPATTKTVSLTIAMGELSLVRATGRVKDRPSGNDLNVDVMPTGLRDGRIRTRVTIEYDPASAESSPFGPPFVLRQTLNVWLQSGQLTVVSQAADPLSDRRARVEVTATLLK